jgi:hypothetical protein
LRQKQSAGDSKRDENGHENDFAIVHGFLMLDARCWLLLLIVRER